MSNSPASVNDIISDEHRTTAFGFWSIGPANGPVYGPIICGFVFQYLGWRWTHWIVAIIGGVVWVLLVSIKNEPLCIFWDSYVAIICAILYLCFVAYPSHSSTGVLIVIALEPFFRKMINLHRKVPEAGTVPP
ncbi:hypothetical protein BBP40_006520 [Aspergillus hancockii]|nr:hypothetical protein BBP40_006520 [Aspergillus hancockii]